MDDFREHDCWGKLSIATDGSVTTLALSDHCLDVAAVFRALVSVPTIKAKVDATAGQELSDEQIDRLSVNAFLHDCGKCNQGFQAKSDPTARHTAGHVMEAVALLFEQQDRFPPVFSDLIADIAGWFASDEQAIQILLASISHHGRPISLSDYERWADDPANRYREKLWLPVNSYDPLIALDELAKVARQAFPAAFALDEPPINANAALQQRFAGLVMLADWIGSDTQFFPYFHGADLDRLTFSHGAAQRALSEIGIIPPEVRAAKAFESVFSFHPRPLQRALTEIVRIDEDARLLLAESDTGSGKTEAALGWFFRLYEQRRVNGLYFALPTRVAARELYERVRQAVDSAFDSEHRPGPVLLAAPGYVKVDGADIPPALVDPQGTLWDDNRRDQLLERFWSAERPKRFLAAPIAVGTIDQALLSALHVKHSLLRSVCLDRHLLVVDEVHASDPYMREVLKALLRGHIARGGWALLLSATLGETAASEYFERPLAPLQDAIGRPYPLVTSRTKHYPTPAAGSRHIAVELAPTLTDDAALLPALIQALETGARVLVICNTVARANSLFRSVEAALHAEKPQLLPALFALDGVRCPHHGRFAREDRERLDAAVTAQLGKGSPAGARLLIGTQTLEQSLDIDADWLITDLAPMDVLIQRFGRLHRHERHERPTSFKVPRVLLRVPDKPLAEYLNGTAALRAPAGLGSVYADGRVLALTWASLKNGPGLELPSQARERIEDTTHPEAFDALPEIWQRHGLELMGRVRAEVLLALRSVLDEEPFGDLHYPDTGERVLTRLGDPCFDIPLAPPMTSPFGAAIDRVAIPARWLQGAEPPQTVSAEPTDEGFRFTIGPAAYRYTRFGLEKDDA